MHILETKDVLLIDDDKSIRSLIASALMRLGLQADTAADGAAGIDLIATTSYSVVVVDLMMPRVDGPAFINALREREVHSRVRPVVFLMTAFPVENVPVSGKDVQAVVAKPFDVLELAELVRDCVESWRRHGSRDAGMSEAPAESKTPPGPFETN